MMPMLTSCGIQSGTDNKQNIPEPPSNVTQISDNEILVNGAKYILTFSDDFDGKKLDGQKWKCCPEWKRGDVGGKWSNKMTSLEGKGNLVLTASLKKSLFGKK